MVSVESSELKVRLHSVSFALSYEPKLDIEKPLVWPPLTLTWPDEGCPAVSTTVIVRLPVCPLSGVTV